jgi:cobalt-precorrin 5A hydrolase/precorrin-3B C17-methyltransferase
MPFTPSRVVGFALSKEAIPLLQRLRQAGWLGEIRWPDDPISPADWLAREWPRASAVVAVAAAGLVTRLVAPLLVSKATDPAIVVLDPEGRFVVPMLGGHGAGGEALGEGLGGGGEVERAGKAIECRRIRRLADALQRSISAEFNGEKLIGLTWPAAQGHTTVLELTY